MRKGKDGFYYRYIKRLLDIILALILLIPTVIIVGICYICIKIETKGPAFFVQLRPGYKGKIFKMYKLRTMILETERNGKPLTDVERTTKVGRIVRACSCDELCQLINVVRGDMSFIGPRPLLVRYLPLYTNEQMRRHDVLPGISGWAQVNGRNQLSWDGKFALDVWYVDNVSFELDCKILWLTIKNIFIRKSIKSSDAVSSPYFEKAEEKVK